MSNSKVLIVLVSFLLAFQGILKAQNKWSVEIRPGLDFPTEELAGADLKTGFGFEAAVAYRFIEHLGAYVGWGYNAFTTDDSFAGTDTDFDETGYTFGLQFIHPIGQSERVSYLIRAGGIYNHIEVENDSGDIIDDSGHGLGWEAGVGVSIDLGSNWDVRPQVGYRALTREIEIENIPIDLDLNYVVFGVGVVKRF